MTALRLLLVLLATIPVAACDLAGDILEAGIVIGVLMVVAVIGLIGFVIAKLRS